MMADRTTLPDRLVDDDNFILALAQHYGVRTRLLDWSLDPAVALYWAASEALRNPPKSGKFSVFALGEIYLRVGVAGQRAQLVFPDRAANPNLTAQRGLLVRHDWSSPDMWDADTASTIADLGKITGKLGDRVIRLDAPATDASQAVYLLSRRGVDASVIYPSEHGIARFGEDFALLDSTTRARFVDRTLLYVPTEE